MLLFSLSIILLQTLLLRQHVCYSFSMSEDLKRRRGWFPLRRITGDGNSQYEFPTKPIELKQEWVDGRWPFTKNDFGRIDYYNDGIFYALPRLLYHIDEPAVCALTQHYRKSISQGSDVLDICSSWVSHYPTEFPQTMNSIQATGMNAIELFFNDQLTNGYKIADLNGNGIVNKAQDNSDTIIKGDGNDSGNYDNDNYEINDDSNTLFEGFDDESMDFITCALSIDYLIDPIKVLRGCNRILRPGGKVIVSFSNRCFGTKAIRLWRVNNSNFHVELINAFFKYAGNYEIPTTAYDITPTSVTVTRNNYQDPLYVVEAIK